MKPIRHSTYRSPLGSFDNFGKCPAFPTLLPFARSILRPKLGKLNRDIDKCCVDLGQGNQEIPSQSTIARP